MLPRKCQAHRHRPVRLRRPAALLAVLLIAIGLGVAESAAALNQDDLRAASEIPVSSPAYGPLPVDPSCQHLPVADCIVQQGSPGSRRVLVVGDSHALFLVPPMLAIAKEKDLTLAVSALPGCPWQIGLVYVKSTHAACTAAKHVWYTKVIPEFQPDIILFATRASDHRGASKYAVMSTTPWLTADTQSGLLALATRKTLAALARPHQEFLIEEPIPVASFDTYRCLELAQVAASCTFTSDVAPSIAELAYRRLATTRADTVTISLDRMICPRLPRCDAVVGGSVVRRDGDHLTERFAAQIFPNIEQSLERLGVLPR